jgi:hypothetical protein
MLIISGTSDKIQAITSSAATIDVLANYYDNNAGTITPDRDPTAIASATTTDIVGSPGSSIQRAIETITFRNRHASTSCTVTVQALIGGVSHDLYKRTLDAGEAMAYIEGKGWVTWDANGVELSRATSPQSVQVLASGTAATYTTPVGCKAIWVRMVGGGGAGGSSDGAASATGVGAGGGAGGYVEKLIVNPAATYTYTIGAGGTKAAAGNNAGGNGADTTFTGLTAKGGTGGGSMANGTTALTVKGGAGGVAGSGGDINPPGMPGGFGVRISATIVMSGFGGDTPFGSGPDGQTAHVAGTDATANTGAGGGGAASVNTNADFQGGNGGSGLIVVTEYY